MNTIYLHFNFARNENITMQPGHITCAERHICAIATPCAII